MNYLQELSGTMFYRSHKQNAFWLKSIFLLHPFQSLKMNSYPAKLVATTMWISDTSMFTKLNQTDLHIINFSLSDQHKTNCY